ncbi:MAG TPA: hypothetical protein VI194_13980 [Mycobacterium sp.]
MDRIWQWAWDRYGARYSWAVYALSIPFSLPPYLFPVRVFGLDTAATRLRRLG